MITKKESKARGKKKHRLRQTLTCPFLSPCCNENLCVERNSLAFQNMSVKETSAIKNRGSIRITYTYILIYIYTILASFITQHDV